MKPSISTLGLSAVALLLTASSAMAGVAAPAPLLGAGLPGLAILVTAGAGYLGVRKFRRRG